MNGYEDWLRYLQEEFEDDDSEPTREELIESGVLADPEDE